jgi:hypothetical protein
MDFRASYGEKITEESWVMRDLWQTTNINYGAKWGLAKYPKKMKSSGIKRIIERALWRSLYFIIWTCIPNNLGGDDNLSTNSGNMSI